MKGTILKTKILIYLLLVVLTVIYACMSFVYYEKDLESRIIPQVMRAMVQVSQLLPQLEKNEQAVREVYDNLENSRRRVYQNNEDTLAQQGHSGEDAETVINNTLSWMNRVTMLRVGRRGHVIVVSQDDDTILAHPDEQFVGEAIYPIGNVDLDFFHHLFLKRKSAQPASMPRPMREYTEWHLHTRTPMSCAG